MFEKNIYNNKEINLSSAEFDIIRINLYLSKYLYILKKKYINMNIYHLYGSIRADSPEQTV